MTKWRSYESKKDFIYPSMNLNFKPFGLRSQNSYVSLKNININSISYMVMREIKAGKTLRPSWPVKAPSWNRTTLWWCLLIKIEDIRSCAFTKSINGAVPSAYEDQD
eukprot:GHVP01019861.1.p1 GENE.GHVP01019861.1~~GHVP01019861.1.p1  ORF type:complete len:107 (-),score=6.85 GHVP01019861.1:146-466(-)